MCPRRTMDQKRLNSSILLKVDQKKLDILNIIDLVNESGIVNKSRLFIFEKGNVKQNNDLDDLALCFVNCRSNPVLV